MKKYIVGIDFGHGETAAWVVPVINVQGTDMKPEGESLKLRVSTTSANDKLMDSVVYRSRTGEFSLEQHACSDIYTELKSPVSQLVNNPEKQRAYMAYIRLVIDRLLSVNSTLLGKEDGEWNFHLCIACPTKWGEKDKNDYIHFFNEALSEKGLSVLWVINESDAAFFTHRPKDNPNQCVLVVDFGSSTIDYTVIQNGKKVSDDSWSNAQLGASCIERAVRIEYKNTAHDEYQSAFTNTERILMETDNARMSVESRLLYNMRKQKEESFKNGAYPQYYLDFNFGTYTGQVGKQNPFKPYSFEFYGNLEAITAKYRKAVLADFEKLRTRIASLLGDDEVNRIVLSGGACNMQWVKRMLQAVFANADIVEDREPSYVVAKGIALYAQAQQQTIENLKIKIEHLPYSQLYRTADTEARAYAIKELLPNVMNDIKGVSNISGNQIRRKFCDFIQSLNPNNVNFCNIVQSHLDLSLSKAINSAVDRAIQEIFNISVNISSVKVHVQMPVIPWDPRNFQEGGGWYDSFSQWIDDASGRFSFSWDLPRELTERNKIAEGTRVRLIQDAEGGMNLVYPELFDTVKYLSNCAQHEALNVFYTKQLFKTTFS